MNKPDPLDTSMIESKQTAQRLQQVNLTTHFICCPQCGNYISTTLNYRKARKDFKCYNKQCYKVFNFPAQHKRSKTIQTKRKAVNDVDIWKPKILENKLQMHYNKKYPTTKKTMMALAFVATLFVSGARISEIVGVRNPKYCFRDRTKNEIGMKSYIVEPVKKEQINKKFHPRLNKEIIHFEQLPILKHRNNTKQSYSELIDFYKRREVMLLYADFKPFVDHITNYTNLLDDESVVFPFSKQRGYDIIHEITGKHPHFFRHMMATHLTKFYGFNDNKLKQFFGWTTSSQASRYSHLQSDDLLITMTATSANQNVAVLEQEKEVENDEK